MRSRIAPWITRIAVVLVCLAAGGATARAIAPGRADAGDIVYVYDDVGRLVSAVDASGNGVAYRYDAAGNLIGVVPSGSGGPVITGIAPSSGAPGTVVTISGTGFGSAPADHRITFNGAPATATSASDTRLVTRVPPDATTGPITVTTASGVARSATPFTVTTADLALEALSAPSAAAPGQNVQINWTVTNRGSATAKPKWADVVYLSRDELCCEGDSPVATADTIAPLAPDRSYKRARTIKIPPAQPAGQHYLIAVTDTGRAVPELSETNNARIAPIAIAGLDLAPTAFSAPAQVVAGERASVSWSAINQGSGTIFADWMDEVLLSPSPTCCAGALVAIAHRRNGPLPAGRSYSATKAFTVPALPPGTYHLFLGIDNGAAIGETDETNNRRSLPIAITAPDLVTTAFSAPESARAGQRIALEWSVRNDGTGAARPPWTDSVYLQRDQVCCDQNARLAFAGRGARLAPGASYAIRRNVVVPRRPPGAYYLILRTDSGLDVHETDEANNQRVVPFTVAP